jgi:hypothetical protein
MLLLFVAVLVSFLAASVAANFAVIFSVVDSAITTTTTSTGLLEVKGTDTIAKTATATQDVPLLVAPVLDLETLGNVKSLKVQYYDNDAYSDPIEALLSIVAVRKHNSTYVEFVTDVMGEKIEVINGEAVLVQYPTQTNDLEMPKAFEICSANATCSAFKASGIDVDAAYGLAREELHKAGFADRARRLTPAYGYCYAGSWTASFHCGYEHTGGGTFVFRGYCFPGGPLGGALEGESSSGSGKPMYHNHPTGPPAPPAAPHPHSPGDAYTYYWPPQTGALWSYYWSGWGPMKHIVFLAHGKFGWYSTTYEMFCDAAAATTSCPAFEQVYFRHLVFVFASSGITDYGFMSASGWSSNVYDSSTYTGAAGALATVTSEVRTDNTGAYISAFNCRYVRIYVCHYLGSAAATKKAEEDKKKGKDDRDGKGDEDAAPFGGKFGTKAGKTRCWLEHRLRCPFNSRTEMMIVGYSDGGGLAVFMNYYNTLVTKAVAIDFWGFSSYETWMTSAGGTMDAKIYTNCASSMFDHGPAAIFENSVPDLNYVTGMGMAADSWEYLGINSYSYTGGAADIPYYEWSWEDSCTKQRLNFAVHGLGVDASTSPPWACNGPACTPPVQGHDDWAKWNGAGGSELGDQCGANTVSANVHVNMKSKADVLGDIVQWLNSSSWGSCVTGRRLASKQDEFKNAKEYNDAGLDTGNYVHQDRDSKIDAAVKDKNPYDAMFDFETSAPVSGGSMQNLLAPDRFANFSGTIFNDSKVGGLTEVAAHLSGFTQPRTRGWKDAREEWFLKRNGNSVSQDTK